MRSQAGDRAIRVRWGIEAPSVRGPKARWSLPEITAAAVDLADRDGLDGVSLARVAASLSMTTTALYRYVDSKDVLVELMVDAGLGPPPRLTGSGWRQRCTAWVGALRNRYHRHPWLADVRPAGMPRQPHPFGWIDALAVALAERPDVDGMRLALLLDGLVRTYSGIARGTPDADQVDSLGWVGPLVADRYPALAALARRDYSDPDAELEFALDLVLRGVAAAG